MASKNAKKGSSKRREAKKALELSREAKAEAAKLLKGSRLKNITTVEMNTGLKEVNTKLIRIMHLILKIL
jgi:hypothetical protein